DTGKADFAILSQLRPIRRGIQVHIDRVPNDLGVGQAAANLLFGKPPIGFRNEIAPLRGSQSYLVPPSVVIINPKAFCVSMLDGDERQSSVNAQLKQIDWWKGSSLRNHHE